MQDIWFIADTHFNHKNMIEYERKEVFNNVDEMNEALIENWNKYVKPNDTIYHLGDVTFSNAEIFKPIIDRLNGNKRLRIGNHDKWTVTKYKKLGFEEVYKRDMLIPYADIVISHYPIVDTKTTIEMKKINCFNVCGHVHSQTSGLDNNFHKVVSVECTNYSPIHLDEILTWQKQIQNKGDLF